MNIDPCEFFSPELRSLMGEWATYFVINSNRRQHAWFFTEDLKVVARKISDRKWFETEAFNIGPSGPFDDMYHLFFEMEVFKETEKKFICKATCKYEEIWNVLRQKHAEPKSENVHLFWNCANDWGVSPITKSESESFTIDKDCIPLFNQFIEEGFVLQRGNHYFWTPKIRPYLEGYIWSSKSFPDPIDRQRSIIEKLEPEIKTAMDKCAISGDKISAVAMLEKSSVFKNTDQVHGGRNLSLAKKIVELMYTKTWAPIDNKPLHWTWYGEVPSQS